MIQVHTLQLDLNWNLLKRLGALNRFDASWATIEKREGKSLKELKSVATVKSVAASTRIEGSQMSNEEVNVLLQNLDITQLEERDEQEVVGYFEVLDLITESPDKINVTEGDVRNLHAMLLSKREEDSWHRGGYKQHSNSVELTSLDGTTQIIFETTPPGFETEDAMSALFEWYHADEEVDPLVKCALFAYEFVSIHPFQDGNGRLSRLISTLLLLKHGYKWVQYVSFEHEIEDRKDEYYRVLRSCQGNRPNEDVTLWLHLFFDALENIQKKLMKKLETSGEVATLPIKASVMLKIIEIYPGIQFTEIAKRTGMASTTAKRYLAILLEKNLVKQYGRGRATYYMVV